MFAAMCERKFGQLQTKGAQHRLMRDAPQSQYYFKLRKRGDGCGEIRTAIRNFRWQRLVLQWHTPHGVSYGALIQLEAIVDALGIGPACEAISQKRFVKQIAGKITGKGTA